MVDTQAVANNGLFVVRNLGDVRSKVKWTQQYLARKCGVATATVYHVETPRFGHQIRGSTLNRLLQGLGNAAADLEYEQIS
jgi:DNA-binding XRE family transcriptional regulator